VRDIEASSAQFLQLHSLRIAARARLATQQAIGPLRIQLDVTRSTAAATGRGIQLAQRVLLHLAPVAPTGRLSAKMTRSGLFGEDIVDIAIEAHEDHLRTSGASQLLAALARRRR
jgi:hypothetical protein